MKQELQINCHSIFVETAGPLDGPPVVLLHHGLGAIRSWKAQIPILADAGFRVVAYDRWGHGKSAPRERWAIPNAELWLLPELGHMPAQERPEEFNQKILRFIRKPQTEETKKLQFEN